MSSNGSPFKCPVNNGPCQEKRLKTEDLRQNVIFS